MRLLKYLLVVSLLMSFSCEDYKVIPPKGEEPIVPDTIKWDDEMFVLETQENGEIKTIFRTNDSEYINPKGFTFWTVWGETKEFVTRTVKMSKTTGSNIGGYGIVFCQTEEIKDGKPTQKMLVVMINNNGQYIIGKAEDGTFIDIDWWQTTPALYKNPGATNVITVSYDEDREQYILFINNHEVDKFSSLNDPPLRSGRNGYITVITPLENFKTSGIDVQFIEER